MKPEKKFKKYSNYYRTGEFKKKLAKVSGKLGTNLLYYLSVLYLLISEKNIPYKTRIIFIAALGYFILPTDLVSDFLPVLGYTDDLAFITYAFATATDYITPEIQEKARKRVDSLLNRGQKEAGKSA